MSSTKTTQDVTMKLKQYLMFLVTLIIMGAAVVLIFNGIVFLMILSNFLMQVLAA